MGKHGWCSLRKSRRAAFTRKCGVSILSLPRWRNGPHGRSRARAATGRSPRNHATLGSVHVRTETGEAGSRSAAGGRVPARPPGCPELLAGLAAAVASRLRRAADADPLIPGAVNNDFSNASHRLRQPSWRAEARHPRLLCPEPRKVMDADLRRHDEDGAVRVSIFRAPGIMRRTGHANPHGGPPGQVPVKCQSSAQGEAPARYPRLSRAHLEKAEDALSSQTKCNTTGFSLLFAAQSPAGAPSCLTQFSACVGATSWIAKHRGCGALPACRGWDVEG